MHLEVNNKVYGGWKSINVQLSIEQIANAFRIGLTEKWSDAPKWPIRVGDKCELIYSDMPVISGYVDTINSSFNPEKISVEIEGRDKTADLVDCSVKPKEYHNISLVRLCEYICSPFGISVINNAKGKGTFNKFEAELGETAFDCLERAARQRGCLLNSDGRGRLVITKASSELLPVSLIEGQNILTGSIRVDGKERYSDYIVYGQSPVSKSESSPGLNANARAKDPSIKRHRPLILLSEDGEVSPQIRCDWECNVRSGRGSQITIGVSGWEYETGKLWPINKLVKVGSPTLKVDKELLITGVNYILFENTYYSTLTLQDKNAWLPEPIIKQSGNGEPSIGEPWIK